MLDLQKHLTWPTSEQCTRAAPAGAQIPLEDVPSVQKEVVMRCRQAGKPVIVASHLLQSMIEYPTPTRAEVADISDVVRQRADALMLSGESAIGEYPDKAVGVLRAVAAHIEEWCRWDLWRPLIIHYKLCRCCGCRAHVVDFGLGLGDWQPGGPLWLGRVGCPCSQ